VEEQRPGKEPAEGPAGLAGGLVSVPAVVLVVASVAWAADVYRPLGLVLFMEQFVAGILALALLLVFLSVPARRGPPRARAPWYDVVAGLAGFLSAGYIAVRYPELGELMFVRPLDGLVAGCVVLALALEGLRRTVGRVLLGVTLSFIAYGLLGHLVPGMLSGRPVAWDRLAYYLAYDSHSILGTPMIVAATIVIPFVLFGQLLSATGGSAFFTDVSLAVMGRYRGGSAKIAVTASGFFGSISGSAVSNVVSTGVVTIPMMRRAGFRPHYAGAIEASASNGGQIVPPVMGTTAFLIAEFLQVPYREVVLAALLPALLYYVTLFIVADLEAAKGGIARVEEALIPRTITVLKAGWYFPLPFVVLIWALFMGGRRPETAALYASVTLVAGALLFGYKSRRPSLHDFVDAVRKTGLAVLDIIMICVAAGVVIGVLAISGLGFGLTLALVKVAGNSTILLLALSAVVCIVLGMGMPTVGVYVLLAALVAPALVEVGIQPMAAHLFVMYYGMMSMITPPVAIAAFAAASLARTDSMRTAFAAMRFGWIAYVIPLLFVFSPTLILDGMPRAIAFAIVTAIGGVWLNSIAVVGYFVRPMRGVERVAFSAAGLMMLTPAGLFANAVYLDVAGIVFGMVLLARELTLRRRLAKERPLRFSAE
jgi:TRAP transporter 4TM/12TM fusion protein